MSCCFHTPALDGNVPLQIAVHRPLQFYAKIVLELGDLFQIASIPIPARCPSNEHDPAFQLINIGIEVVSHFNKVKNVYIKNKTTENARDFLVELYKFSSPKTNCLLTLFKCEGVISFPIAGRQLGLRPRSAKARPSKPKSRCCSRAVHWVLSKYQARRSCQTQSN